MDMLSFEITRLFVIIKRMEMYDWIFYTKMSIPFDYDQSDYP